ncbi:hypothetical protein [Pedobacter aquatilis]|uniref:hypothetical protein n=1 Tax=Pedobacter aquatilis TaxID=351343 RepID=UPI00292DEF87|nr:hypothetical protein [Pedobacter aquatilis]
MNEDIVDTSKQIETQYLIDTNKFILLSVLTFGFYQIWWFYKSWRFFQQKDNADLAPAIRTIFGIVFIIPLFTRIKGYAISKSYKKRFHSGLLFLAYLITTLLSYLPFPAGILSIFSVFVLLQPFTALNFAKRNSADIIAIEQKNFNVRQIILMIIGGILWLFNIYYIYLMRSYGYETN